VTQETRRSHLDPNRGQPREKRVLDEHHYTTHHGILPQVLKVLRSAQPCSTREFMFILVKFDS